MALQRERETANIIDCLLKYYIYIYKYKYIYTHTFVYKHVYSQSMSYLRKVAEGVLSAVRRERVLFLLLLFLLKCCSLCFWAKDVLAALLGSLLLNRRAFPAINMHGKCRLLLFRAELQLGYVPSSRYLEKPSALFLSAFRVKRFWVLFFFRGVRPLDLRTLSPHITRCHA